MNDRLFYFDVKRILIIFYISVFIFNIQLEAQKKDTVITGNVSFVSSKNTYVKFESTKAINNGDTLYLKQGQELVAALIVINKSSTSCVCISINDFKFVNSMAIYFKYTYLLPVETTKKEPEIIISENTLNTEDHPLKNQELKHEIIRKKTTAIKIPDNEWKGRFSIASYSSFSNIIQNPSHRLNYTLSLNGNRIGKTGLSFETYVSFRHKIDEWYKVKENINDALKIYSFAAKYSFSKDFEIYFGRKINYRLSSMGAIDGIQIEKTFHNIAIGAVIGSRPDLYDYSLNSKLFQTGAFVGYNFDIGNKFNSQNTVALVEQMNHGATDRRFLHVQHSSTLFNNLSIFSSLEFDLYQKIKEVTSNTMHLTNLYLTMRYRFSRKLSISTSYDARSNIIYFETDKNTIDRLLEEATRQGLRVQVNYQPFRLVSLGCSGNLSFQKDNRNESKNVNAYLSYSKVPWLNLAINITSNYLQTQYLESKVIGINLSRDLVKDKVFGEVYYRYADYRYTSYDNAFGDKIVGFNLSYRVDKNLTCNLYCEETFEQNSKYLIVNMRAMLRF